MLILYQTAFIFAHTLLKSLTYLPSDELYCQSPNLLENIGMENRTVFCQLTGIVNITNERNFLHCSTLCIGALTMYCTFPISLFWLFHCGTFFWGVFWPYHYSVSKTSGRIKYYHISAVVISLSVPLILVLAVQFNGGYGLILSLYPLCGPACPEALFYGILLPLDIIIASALSLLIATLWHVADMVSYIIFIML